MRLRFGSFEITQIIEHKITKSIKKKKERNSLQCKISSQRYASGKLSLR